MPKYTPAQRAVKVLSQSHKQTILYLADNVFSEDVKRFRPDDVPPPHRKNLADLATYGVLYKSGRLRPTFQKTNFFDELVELIRDGQ